MKKIKYAIGVDLGGTSVKTGIVSTDGKIIKKGSLPTNAEQGPEAVIEQIKESIRVIIKSADVNIEGIGIGSPGAVIHEKGTVENPPNFPGWESVELGKILEKEFNTFVSVDNDANAAAIGELIYGAGREYENFIMVTLGTGVGGGIILNKQLFRGEQGAAGELGHITIDHNGRKCKCGSRGCIETYVGNNYMVAGVKRRIKKHSDSLLYKWTVKGDQKLTPKLIYEASMLEDKFAVGIIKDVGTKLGHALASVINLLDASNLVVGGGVAGFGDLLFEAIKKGAAQRVLKPLRPRINVKPAQLKNSAGIKGAAALVFYKS